MADALTPEQPTAAPVPAVPARQEQRLASIQRRFGLAYFGLAVIVGVAVGILAVLIGRSSSHHTAWSAFKPTAHGLEAAQQIASHVSGSYRLTDGQPLAGALADAPVVTAQQQVSRSASSSCALASPTSCRRTSASSGPAAP